MTINFTFLSNLGNPSIRRVSELIAFLRPCQIPKEIIIEFVTPIRILRPEYLPLEPPHSPNQKEIARGLRDFYEFIQVLANRIGVIWQTYGKDWIGQSEFFRWRNALLKASKNISLKDLELRKKTYFAMLKTNSVQSKWMVLSVLCTPQEILLT